MKIKKLLTLFIVIAFFLVLIPGASAVSLVTPELSERCKTPEGCNLCDFVGMFINGANILVALSGSFSILMFVFGGIIIITAYGNDARVKWGRDVLTATVTGIFIVLFAWTLVNLIIGSLFGGSNVPDWANLNREGVCSGQTT